MQREDDVRAQKLNVRPNLHPLKGKILKYSEIALNQESELLTHRANGQIGKRDQLCEWPPIRLMDKLQLFTEQQAAKPANLFSV